MDNLIEINKSRLLYNAHKFFVIEFSLYDIQDLFEISLGISFMKYVYTK